MSEEKERIEITKEDSKEDEINETLEREGEVHIHAGGEDGEEVDININKDNKQVEVNVDKEGKKQKVKISLSGIKVNSEDKNISISFIPIFLIAAVTISAVLFFLYKVLELIFSIF